MIIYRIPPDVRADGLWRVRLWDFAEGAEGIFHGWGIHVKPDTPGMFI